MAKLKFEAGTEIANLNEIAETLKPLNIKLAYWPVAADVKSLLEKNVLTDAEKEAVLKGLDLYFNELKEKAGYQSRDLIVLHQDLSGLEDLLQKFNKAHTHDDDEVRYIIDGAGVFGFQFSDGSQVALTVEASEYINVPKDTVHWFYLTPSRRIKAVRYFTDTKGWTPVYTNDSVRV